MNFSRVGDRESVMEWWGFFVTFEKEFGLYFFVGGDLVVVVIEINIFCKIE